MRARVAAEGGLVIEVADTGIGIAPDKLALVFEPFEQADEERARRYGGAGLGLAICRSLVGLLGADLRVESVVDRGTTFTLSLVPKPSAAARAPVASAPGGNGHG